VSLAVSTPQTSKPELFVYALGSGPSREMGLWLDAFNWQCSANLNDVSRWLMSQAHPNLLIDLRVSPQRMLAETKYLCERFSAVRFVVLVRADQKHWGQEAIRLGAAFYLSPEHCSGEGLAMLLDGQTLQQTRQPSIQPRLDPLTGLVNRPLCFDRLDHALTMARRRESLTGLLLMNVDRFREINHQQGERTADTLLQLVTQRIGHVMRASDTLARLDNDNFALIIEDLHDEAMLGHIASKIHQQFSEPLMVDGQSIVLTLGIGGQLASAGDMNADALFRQASAALQRAKETGRRGLWFYSQALNMKAIARNNMEQGLQKALSREEFMVQFQPVHLGSNGELAAAEVILRWRHPTAGVIPNQVFQPLLESSGLVDEVDRWLLKHVAQQLQTWQKLDAWPDDAPVMLPIGLKQIRNQDFARFVTEHWTQCGLATHQLMFEVDEEIPMQHADLLREFMELASGVGIAVNVSSLADRQMALTFLKHLNIKVLKIGQASIRNIDVDHMDAAVTRVVMEIAHIYGVEVLAQDVDSRYQIEKLRALGCDRFQGHVYSKPVEGEEWISYLKTRTHQNPNQL